MNSHMVAKIPNRKSMGTLFTDENEYLKHLEKLEIKEGYQQLKYNKDYRGRGRPRKCIDHIVKKSFGEYHLSFD
jgi:hypothetical protein